MQVARRYICRWPGERAREGKRERERVGNSERRQEKGIHPRDGVPRCTKCWTSHINFEWTYFQNYCTKKTKTPSYFQHKTRSPLFSSPMANFPTASTGLAKDRMWWVVSDFLCLFTKAFLGGVERQYFFFLFFLKEFGLMNQKNFFH